jgi:TonB family protein
MCGEVPGKPRRAWRARAAAVVVPAVLAMPSWSQTPPSAADGAPSEAARRAAMSPFRMILQNADAARAKPAPAPVKKSAPAVAERPAAAAATPVAARPSAVAATAASAATAAAAPPAPEPQAEQVSVAAPTAQAAREPAPPVELVPLKQDPPRLSAALRREQPQGSVKIAFAVKPDGKTSDVHVVSSTNHRLNTASVDAVSGWQFKPIDETRPMEVELIFRDDQ